MKVATVLILALAGCMHAATTTGTTGTLCAASTGNPCERNCTSKAYALQPNATIFTVIDNYKLLDADWEDVCAFNGLNNLTACIVPTVKSIEWGCANATVIASAASELWARAEYLFGNNTYILEDHIASVVKQNKGTTNDLLQSISMLEQHFIDKDDEVTDTKFWGALAMAVIRGILIGLASAGVGWAVDALG